MRRLLLLLAVLASTLLFGCMLDPGDACEVTGDGFTRRDPCETTCVAWAVSCADGSQAVPDVCSGADCTGDPSVCGAGWGCAQINATDAACIPDDVCPSGFEYEANPAVPWRRQPELYARR